jgi:hypothetical protein
MFNYDPGANTNNGGCIRVRAGCMDDRAVNYDPAANTPLNGSCRILGCTSILATNFDEVANENDGSCIIFGCTNMRAANYLQVATIDDGACEVHGCIDAYAFNFDYHANKDDGSCVPPVLGCTNATASNFDPDANVDDRSCLGGRCTNDLEWTDSDGDGCSRYYLSYCGFESSARRCPTVCGKCTLDIRPGCDGVAGSGLVLDACGVCGGDGSHCLTANCDYFCSRGVGIFDAMGVADAAACVTQIRAAGGFILFGSIVLAEPDCMLQSPSMPAWKMNGWSSAAECAVAWSCITADRGTCVPQQTHLSHVSWEMNGCPALNRTSLLCNDTALADLSHSAYHPGMPDSAGSYSYDIANALANALFANHEGSFRNCEATCVYSMDDTTVPETITGYSWEPRMQCWAEIDSSHECLAGNSIATSVQQALANLCPPPATEFFSPEAYLDTPTNEKVYLANTESAPDPVSEAGGKWLRSPETFNADDVVAEAVLTGAGWSWNVEDRSGSGGQAS